MMKKDTRSGMDQLEDALLRFGAVGAGLLGGFPIAGLLRETVPPLAGLMIGGAVAGGTAALVVMVVFRVINPKRVRGKGKREKSLVERKQEKSGERWQKFDATGEAVVTAEAVEKDEERGNEKDGSVDFSKWGS